MITILRKHHRWLMIVIAILAIPFVFYFSQTPDFGQRTTDLGRIYDRPITQVEFTRHARILNLANALGLSLGNDLMTSNVQSEAEMYVEFTWNRLVLHREVEQLGISPTFNQITAFIKTLPRFRGEGGGFDPNKYNEFKTGMLPGLGFNETQLEEVIADQLSLNRAKELVGAGVQVPESESKENYEKAYGKMDVAVVRVKGEDLEKDVKVTDEEVAKTYETRKDQLKSEEKRKVEFVTFTLTEEEKKLTGKDRKDPLQKVADRANDFSQALLEKDANFTAIAGKLQTPVIATGEFTSTKPDPLLAINPQLTQYAFQLTPQTPFSDPIQGPDGFYVLHLLGVVEAHPLSLEEAKENLIVTLKSERLRELVSSKGTEVARQLREALKAHGPLEKAAEQSGFKLERVPAFAVVEAPTPKPEADTPKVEAPKKDETPDLRTIKSAVSALDPGQVSDFMPVGKGGLVAVLEKRAPAEPSGYDAAKTQFETRYLSQNRGAVFVEWLRDRRKAAGAVMATNG